MFNPEINEEMRIKPIIKTLGYSKDKNESRNVCYWIVKENTVERN